MAASNGNVPQAGRVLLILFLGVLMGALDIAIVGPALPSLGHTFGVDARALAWVLTVYVLCNLIATPLGARLSDLHGRRPLYRASVILFGAGSVMVALAGSFPMLLVGRAIQGFGSGGVFPVATAVIGDLFPPERRGRALGVLGAVFGLAFLIGPILGGVLLPFGWPWLFWVNVPVALAVAVAAGRILPAGSRLTGAATDGDARKEDTQKEREVQAPPGRLDWVGLLLLGSGLTALTLGTGAVDVELGAANLTSSAVAPWIAAALLLLGCFWRREQRVESPLLHPVHFQERQLRIANVLAVLAGTVEAGLVFVPSLTVTAFRVDPATASFLLLPPVVAMAVGSPLVGRLLDRYGSRLVIGWGLWVLGLGLLAVRWATDTLVGFLGAGVVIGIGLSSLVGAPLRYIVLNEAPTAYRGSAQAVNTLVRSVGRMLGGVLLGALIASRGGTPAGYHLAFSVLGALVLLSLLPAAALKTSEAERRSMTRSRPPEGVS